MNVHGDSRVSWVICAKVLRAFVRSCVVCVSCLGDPLTVVLQDRCGTIDRWEWRSDDSADANWDDWNGKRIDRRVGYRGAEAEA
jgi:hypothetical protein